MIPIFYLFIKLKNCNIAKSGKVYIELILISLKLPNTNSTKDCNFSFLVSFVSNNVQELKATINIKNEV